MFHAAVAGARFDVGTLSASDALAQQVETVNLGVCLKRMAVRPHVRPTDCSHLSGFGFDNHSSSCLFIRRIGGGGECLAACDNTPGLCPQACGDTGACCRKGWEEDPIECADAEGYVDHPLSGDTASDYHQCVGAPEGFLSKLFTRRRRAVGAGEPRCDPRSDFCLREGGWCYADCPCGYELDVVLERMCIQMCESTITLPTSAGPLCATSPEVASQMTEYQQSWLRGGAGKCPSAVCNWVRAGL